MLVYQLYFFKSKLHIQMQIERETWPAEANVPPLFAQKITPNMEVGNPKSHMGVSKNRGTPKSSILIAFSIINHPFWGTSVFGNIHINVS